MSAAKDSVATRSFVAFPASPFTFSIVIVDGSASRQAVVWIASVDSGGGLPTVSAVSVGTDVLSALTGTSVTSGNLKIEGWGGLITVGAGSQTVSITHDKNGGTIQLAGFAIVATGTDLVNAAQSTTAVASPIHLDMVSSAGDLTTTVDIDNGTVTSTNQTQQGDGSGVVTPCKFDSGPSTANPTHTWTGSGFPPTVMVMAGANFRAVSVAPPSDFAGPASPWIRVRLRDY